MNELYDFSYKSVLDVLPCYITVQDRNLHILFANQTFKTDFGDKIGEYCYEVFKGADKKCEDCPVQKTFDDKKFHSSEETIRLPDRPINQVLVYATPLLDIMGNVVAVVELSANVSSIKNMHKELVTLGQSIALLSHDVKNILEGLQGGVYVVDEGIKDKDTELAQRGWQIVKKNITEITRITQNILYSSKTRVPQRTPIEPYKIAREIISLFQEKATALNVQLLHQLNPNLPAVKMDPSSMRRMLENLIWNAVEACKSERTERSKTVIVRMGMYDDKHWMLEVEDNGPGMDDDTHLNLFKEFFSTKGDAGTGLGLMVVDRIVKNLQGRIDVLTKLGKGSLFRVILSIVE